MLSGKWVSGPTAIPRTGRCRKACRRLPIDGAASLQGRDRAVWDLSPRLRRPRAKPRRRNTSPPLKESHCLTARRGAAQRSAARGNARPPQDVSVTFGEIRCRGRLTLRCSYNEMMPTNRQPTMQATYGIREVLRQASGAPTIALGGGNCWSLRVRNGRCTDLLSQKVSKEECCTSSSVATAWSEEDLDAGTLFFWRVLGGGVPCTACKESCAGVQCGEGRRCVLRRGAPRCVCAADCKAHARLRGPVCGTDGRSYTSVCRLRRRACRRKVPALAVDYPGKCQSSCERVQCGAGRHCLLDQNLRPHCVRCAQRCPSAAAAAASAQPASRQVCGADGVTYPSACHLREAACLKGRAIPEAYKGRCKRSHGPTVEADENRTRHISEGASCSSVRCGDRQTCLTEPDTGAPRCVTCSYRCPRARSRPRPRGSGRAGAGA
ncbi:follistatin-A, partial [Schistocerca americana]|uniref:follistatin-A n=1 Tax=Schistocerca americana TaxID=7009 RepID=UPI001F5021B6